MRHAAFRLGSASDACWSAMCIFPVMGINYLRSIGVCALAFAFLAGCSSINVTSQKNPSADLASLRTFDFTPSQTGSQATHSIVDSQIRNSVKSDLAGVGVTPAPQGASPDFLVVYSTSVVNIATTGSRGGVGVGLGVTPNVGVGVSAPVGTRTTIEQEGNLTLSFIDPRSNQEIWRSTATASLDGSNQDIQKIQDAVSKMIRDFQGARGRANS